MILTVNVGSSSVRLAAHQLEDLSVVAKAHHRRDDAKPEQLLSQFCRSNQLAVQVAAHRVVHGGPKLTETREITPDVEREIERTAPLAPLHNPPALRWIRACREVLGPDVPQVATFDTAFFADLPVVAATYALPHRLNKDRQLRRYGFHGLAHHAMWREWSRQRSDRPTDSRVITLQLGAGCSAAALAGGRPLDTSMGFSPLEGLVMATRSGDVDPGLLTYLQREQGWSGEQLEQILNRESGLLGISGESSEMSSLLQSDAPDAKRAVDVFCYRVRKTIGAYLAVLGGAEALVFGGGIGVHAPEVRRRILEPLQWCGIEVDKAPNEATVGETARISRPNSRIDVWSIVVDESRELAEEARRKTRKDGPRRGPTPEA